MKLQKSPTIATSNYEYGIPLSAGLSADFPKSATNHKPPLGNLFVKQSPEALAETMARKKLLIEQAMLR